MAFEPCFLKLSCSGELKRRAEEAHARLEECRFCPRECGTNRLLGAKGAACRTGERAVVSSYHAHFGEESPLVGYHGSGTIFFSWCNLRCQFCQNYEISQLGQGREVEPEEVALMMLHLQAQGCHNINFVSPTHVVPQILAALALAAEKGLHIPLVYNTGGYDHLETLALLDGVIDIYMPDMKYSDKATARRLSKIKNYPQVNRLAVKEMHRQVGDLVLDEDGTAQRGLLVRHLVLPHGLAGTAQVVEFLAKEISANTYLNIMDQYRPCYKAAQFPEISRPPTQAEIAETVSLVREAGLMRLDERRHWLIFRL